MTVGVSWSLGLGEGRARTSYVLFILLGGVPVAFGRVVVRREELSGRGSLRLGERQRSAWRHNDPLATGAGEGRRERALLLRLAVHSALFRVPFRPARRA